jgi:hypothetical protein
MKFGPVDAVNSDAPKSTKRNRLVLVGAFLYTGFGVLFLLSLLGSTFAEEPLSPFEAALMGFMGFTSLAMGYAGYRAYSASTDSRRRFVFGAGAVFLGMAVLVGLTGGIAFGVPLLCALLGTPDVWERKHGG